MSTSEDYFDEDDTVCAALGENAIREHFSEDHDEPGTFALDVWFDRDDLEIIVEFCMHYGLCPQELAYHAIRSVIEATVNSEGMVIVPTIPTTN